MSRHSAASFPAAAMPGKASASPPRPRSLNDLSQLTLSPGIGVPRIQASRPGASAVAADLEALIPPRFLTQIPFDRLAHVPRYLKAMLLRLERAAGNAARDAERMRMVAPFAEAIRAFESIAPESDEELRLRQEFRVIRLPHT